MSVKTYSRWRVALIVVAAVVLVVGAVVLFAVLNRSVRETAKAVSLGANRFYVEGATSMEPSIHRGDKLAVTTHYGTIRRGDVIVVKSPAPGVKNDVKRVIALPGDRVSTNGLAVFVNGAQLDEPYAQGATIGINAIEVPAGRYYLLGDNRGFSRDSRFYGPVATANIVGAVVRIVAPSEHAGRVPGSSR
jgi:signal peptidase I